MIEEALIVQAMAGMKSLEGQLGQEAAAMGGAVILALGIGAIVWAINMLPWTDNNPRA